MSRITSMLTAIGLAAAALVACQHDEVGAPPADMKIVGIRLGVDIPAAEVYATRALPGDPGTYEHFGLPTVGYVFFVTDGKVYKPGRLVGATPETQTVEEMDNPIALDTWEKSTKEYSIPQTREDSIYRYKGTVYFYVPSGATTGRLYVAASKVPLPNLTPISFSGVDPATNTKYTGTSDEQSVLDIAFDVDEELRGHLQDVYATPYNYCPDDGLEGSVLDGNTYYGTVDLGNMMEVDLLLYHVAAKVDVDWNVAQEKQADVRLTDITATGLKKRGCLLFRPTENRFDYGTDESYSTRLMHDDVGSQWYGRSYFYAIPFRNNDTDKYFDIRLHIQKNGDTGGSYKLLLRQPLPDERFVPWVRADLRFTTDVEYGDEERVRELNDE